MHRWARWAAMASVIGAFACVSILGDFTSNEGPSGAKPDAAPPVGPADAADAGDAGDAEVAEGSAASDAAAGDGASADAEGGTGQLSCQSWLWPIPLVVEDLENAPSHTFSGKFTIFPGAANQVRIVAAKSATPAFSYYTITKPTMQVQQLDWPSNDAGTQTVAAYAVRHVTAAQGGTSAVILAQRTSTGPDVTTSYSVMAMSDLMVATGPLPLAFPLLSGLTPTQTLDDLAVLPFSTTDVFEAASIGMGNPAVYTLGVSRVSPTSPPVTPGTLSTVATSVNEADFAAIRLLNTNGNVYVFDLNDLSNPGTTGWTVPDTAMVASPPPKQVIASGESIGVIGLSPSESAPAADVFMLEQDFSGQFTSGYRYYAGAIDFTSLSSWTVGSLVKLDRTTSPFAAPVFNSSPSGNVAAWNEDNVMLLGPGLRNGVTDAAPAPGLNLLWVNAQGAVRADQTGANEILTNLSDFFWAGATPARISATSAAWDVAWVEVLTTGGSTHHILKMNELECQ